MAGVVMAFQSTAKFDPARSLQADADPDSGVSYRDGSLRELPAPSGRFTLSPDAASTTLAIFILLSWASALAVPVIVTGAEGPLPFIAGAAVAVLCSMIDRAQGAADIYSRRSLVGLVVAVCMAFIVGGLLTPALNGSAAGAPLAWWQGAVSVAIVIALARTLLFAGGVVARQSGRLVRRVAVIGPLSPARARIVGELSGRPDSRVVAMVEPADFRLITARAAAGELDEVVLLRDSGPALRTALDALTLYPIDVSLADEAPVGAGTRTLSYTVQRQRQRGLPAVTKRLIDVVGATLCLIALAPLLFLIAAAIRLETPGPAIFKQRRFGQHGRTFMMWKFRSMRSETSDPTGSRLTSRNDERVTRVGAFIRKTSFDELPQLINILIGDLSFVGPRPHPSGATANGVLYDVLIPNFRARYRVRPGLTGLAQCSGLRGNTDTEKKLFDRFEADMQYVETWSLGLDALVILRTVGHLARGENAY